MDKIKSKKRVLIPFSKIVMMSYDEESPNSVRIELSNGTYIDVDTQDAISMYEDYLKTNKKLFLDIVSIEIV